MVTTPLYENDELLQLIAEGDEQAFATLYRAYVPRLEPFIRNMVRDENLIKEVVQETFTRLWISRERLIEVEYPHTYILRIASYVCFGYLRLAAKDMKLASALEAAGSPENNPTLTKLDIKELERIIREGIDQLTPAQFKIYRLSREEGLKIPEIAARLGISPNTVKNTLVTSLKSIREYAKNAGYSFSLLFLWMFI